MIFFSLHTYLVSWPTLQKVLERFLTQETTNSELERLFQQVRELKVNPYKFKDMATIDFLALLTMIDNKIKNIILKNNNQQKEPFIF